MADMMDKSLDAIVASRRTASKRDSAPERKPRRDSSSRDGGAPRGGGRGRGGPRPRGGGRDEPRRARPRVQVNAGPRARNLDTHAWDHNGYDAMMMADRVRVTHTLPGAAVTVAAPAPAAPAAPVARGGASLPPLRTSTATKITLVNLDPEVDDGALESILSNFGEIKSVEVERNPDGTSVGCGEAVYKTYEAAVSAVSALDGRIVDNRRLVVALDPAAQAAAAAAAAPAPAAEAPQYSVSVSDPANATMHALATASAAFAEVDHSSTALRRYREPRDGGYERAPRGGGGGGGYERAPRGGGGGGGYERAPRGGGGGGGYERAPRGGASDRFDSRGLDRGARGQPAGRGRGRGRDEDRAAARPAKDGQARGGRGGRRDEVDVEASFDAYVAKSKGKGSAAPAAAGPAGKKPAGRGRKGGKSGEEVDADFDAYIAAKGAAASAGAEE